MFCKESINLPIDAFVPFTPNRDDDFLKEVLVGAR